MLAGPPYRPIAAARIVSGTSCLTDERVRYGMDAERLTALDTGDEPGRVTGADGEVHGLAELVDQSVQVGNRGGPQ